MFNDSLILFLFMHPQPFEKIFNNNFFNLTIKKFFLISE